jgi:excisionase family DNA binding protein
MTAEHAPVIRLLLTPEEAADRLSLSRTTVYELIRTGELRSVKIGRARRVPVVALQDYVDGLLAEPDGGSGAA